MQKLFNRILVPVDFTEGSKKVVAMAAVIAHEFICSITLAHVAAAQLEDASGKQRTGSDRGRILRSSIEKYFDQVIKKAFGGAAQPPAVTAVVLYGSWNECLTDYINRYQIDVVISGQENNFFGKQKIKLRPEKIAAETKVPVISIPLNCPVNGLYPIVIPVTDFLPVRKIIYGIYMAAASNAKIKLLAVENKTTATKSGYYLYKSYKLIHDNCPVKTELEIIKGVDVTEAVSEYAHGGNSGLVIVNPGFQPEKKGFLAMFINNILHRYTALPVMTLSPL